MLASPQNVELSFIANSISKIDRVALQDELILFTLSYKDLKKELLENMNDSANDSDRLELEKDHTKVAK